MNKKKWLTLFTFLAVVAGVIFFPTKLINKHRILGYFSKDELDVRQFTILSILDISKIEMIQTHEIKELKSPDLETALKMVLEERIGSSNDIGLSDNIMQRYIQTIGRNVREHLNLDNLSNSKTESFVGVASVKDVKEAIVDYSRNHKDYYYYFTLSPLDDGYKLFVFRTKNDDRRKRNVINKIIK